MRKLSLKEIETISANGNPTGTQCFATGIGLFTGGISTLIAIPIAINCWRS